MTVSLEEQTLEERLERQRSKVKTLMERLDNGAAKIRPLEIEVAKANGGRLPDRLPEQLQGYLKFWEGLLGQYEKEADELKSLEAQFKATQPKKGPSYVGSTQPEIF